MTDSAVPDTGNDNVPSTPLSGPGGHLPGAPPTPEPAPTPPEPTYYASATPDIVLDPDFVKVVLKIQQKTGKRVWLLLQGLGTGPYASITDELWELHIKHLARVKGDGLVVIVDSPGGDARSAYLISKTFRRQFRDFTALVPRYAKSAATLLCLGAKQINLGCFGELGPLDAQIHEAERERSGSALDEVKALEQLFRAALGELPTTLGILRNGTRLKTSMLLPLVMKYSSDMMRPLLENIDTVHYTQMSRILAVGHNYATRLLSTHHSKRLAETIANRLVENYPEHAFAIDADEARSLGLNVAAHEEELDHLLLDLHPYLNDSPVIGFLEKQTQVQP